MSFKRKFLRISGLIIPFQEWFFKFIIENRNISEKSALREKLWALRKGFFLETVKLCGITKENYRDYMRDRAYLNLHPFNKQYSSIIDSKLFLPFLLKDYPEVVPEYYFLINDGRLVRLDRGLSEKENLLSLCKGKKKLVLKPAWGTKGVGFHLLEYTERGLLLNGKESEKKELDGFIRTHNHYLITQYIEQHTYSSDINASSVNTVRISLYRDINDGRFHLAGSFHRFGRAGYLVDNTVSKGGGIVVLIDIESGKLLKLGLSREKGRYSRKIKVTVHPDSGVSIAGVEIPGWQSMIKKILGIFNHLSFLSYVGLDIVVTREGFKIIEINSMPGINAFQLESGILKDENLGNFFTHRMLQKNSGL
ncbi:MAG: sugar-transfer associated ATP-grasp domain-containing protein [Bacteroidota bacterium]